LVRTVATEFSGLEKCTWTIMSLTKAPSFKLSSVDIALTDKFDIMYQEWVDGWQLDVDSHFNSMQSTATTKVTGSTGKTSMNGIVFPHIASGTYLKVAKHNYPIQDNKAGLTNNDEARGMAFSYVNKNSPTACG
jgi:hypothetical protein